MFEGRNVRLRPLDDGIIELVFDRSGESVNKFDAATLDEFEAATTALRSAPGVRGVLVSSTKATFHVGADIFEFTATFRRGTDELRSIVAGWARRFAAFEDLPVPTVAAVNGSAFGGGFELALAADFRIAAEGAQMGLPEVTLGIVPGYGGSVRLPRLTGLAHAVDWIATGKPRSTAQALADRAIDAVVEPTALRDAALAMLREAIEGRRDWQARRRAKLGPVTPDPEADAAALAGARNAAKRTAARFPAASAAIDLLERTAAMPRDAAQAEETRTFADMAATPAAAALVGLFVNDQTLKRKARQLARQARPIGLAGVVGAGIMGGGIAWQSASRGTPALMKDIAQPALDTGMAEARRQTDRQVQSGRIDQPRADAILKAITPRLDWQGFEQADIVVEAVVERLDVKRQVLGEVERLVRPGTILATNTSSLPIGAVAEALQRPESCIGMHFFNPVPVMPLVEVIRGPRTGDEAVATVVQWAQQLGKVPIVVADCPGFLVNRVLFTYLQGFLRLVRDGADFREVDRVMEAFGWPMGPAWLMDVIGLDTCDHVTEVIVHGYAKRMRRDVPDALTLMLAARRLGQKNGVGFWRHELDAKGKPRKLDCEDAHAILAPGQPRGLARFTDAEILDRMMLPLLIETALCVEEHVVDSPVEADMGLILGLGFPRDVGGVLRWADRIGLAELVARADRLAPELGPIYAPTDRMRDMAVRGARFFPD